MLQIQVGARREVDASQDCLGRGVVGAWAGMTQSEAWEAGRGVWKLRADRALQESEVQIIDTTGTVLAVGTITGIRKCGDRYAVEGAVLAGDPRVGQPTAYPHPSRNPVAYITEGA